MGKKVKIIPTSLEVEILGTTKNISTKSLVVLKEGQHLKILKKLNSDKKSLDDLLVVKDGEDLIISYIDGQSLIIENFYSLKDIVVELPVAEYETHLLSSNYTGDSFSIIYAQGDITLFESMFEGNQIALNKISEYFSQNEVTGINSGDEVKTENSSVIEGVSDTTLIVGGVVGVGAIAAAAGGGGSGGGSSSSSSSNTSSTETAQFVDSAVAGASVYKNGVQIGTTDANGYFNYSGTTGDVFSLKVGNLTLGAINYQDIPADGILTIQDLKYEDRTNTIDTDVVAVARFLQTLDADGDASNGIQILTNADGDVVFDANIDDNGDGVVTAQEIAAAQAELTGTEEVVLDVSTTTNTVINSGSNLGAILDAGIATGSDNLVTGTAATAHLDSSLQQMYLDDGYTIVANALELNAAIADASITKIIITGSINFFGLDMSGFTNVFINNFDSSSSLHVTMSPSQITNFSVESGPDDGVIALVEVGDTDLRQYDLTGINQINLNGLDIILTVAQSKNSMSLGGGSFEVIDTLANLTGEVGDMSLASDVTVVLPSDGSVTDISAISLDNNVSIIDLNGQTNVLATFAQASLVQNGSFVVKDTAANIIAQGSGLSVDLIITDEVSISEIGTIEGNTSGTVSFSIIEDTYSNLTDINNASRFTSNPDIVVLDDISIAQVADIDALTTGAITYDISDTLQNLIANPTIVDNANGWEVIDLQTLDTDGDAMNGTIDLGAISLEEALLIDGADVLYSDGGTTSLNPNDVSYTLSVSFAQLLAVDTVPSYYTLSDDPLTISSELTVNEALIVGNASNAADYTFTVSDTYDNVFAEKSNVDALNVDITLTDTTVYPSALGPLSSTLAPNTITINATAISGLDTDVYGLLNSSSFIITENNIAVTITNPSGGLFAATLNDIINNSHIGTVRVLNELTVSGDIVDITNMSNNMASGDLSFRTDPNLTVINIAPTVSEANAMDLLTTGIITATINPTDVATALTITNTNNNNEYTINLGTVSATAVQLDSLNSLYSTITGTITVTTTNGQDLTALDLTNADSIDVSAGENVTVTVSQSADLTLGTGSTYDITDTAAAIDAQETTNNTVLTAAGTVTATAVNNDDLTTLDLSNVDVLDIAGTVTVTDSQAALVDVSDTGSLNIVFENQVTSLDLSNFADTTDTNLSVSSIDAGNSQNDTITLVAADLLDLGSTMSIDIESGDSLSIDGDTNLSDGITGWTKGADNGNYSVYTNDTDNSLVLNISVDGAVIP